MYIFQSMCALQHSRKSEDFWARRKSKVLKEDTKKSLEATTVTEARARRYLYASTFFFESIFWDSLCRSFLPDNLSQLLLCDLSSFTTIYTLIQCVNQVNKLYRQTASLCLISKWKRACSVFILLHTFPDFHEYCNFHYAYSRLYLVASHAPNLNQPKQRWQQFSKAWSSNIAKRAFSAQKKITF